MSVQTGSMLVIIGSIVMIWITIRNTIHYQRAIRRDEENIRAYLDYLDLLGS